ncbi:MAG: DUF2190 family protein [Pseudomonadota bacterium]
MKNYIQPGSTLTVIAAAAVTSGQGVLVGRMFGVAATSAAIGEEYELHRCGVFELPKLEAQAWTVGQRVYWDDGNSRLTTVATGNQLVGAVSVPAPDPSPTGFALLDGTIR